MASGETARLPDASPPPASCAARREVRGHWLVASAGLGSRLASSPRDVPGSDTGGARSHRRQRPSSQSVPRSTYCYVSGTFRSARNEWPADYLRALQTLRSKHRGAEWIPRSQAALGLRSPDVNPGRPSAAGRHTPARTAAPARDGFHVGTRPALPGLSIFPKKPET